MPVVNAYLFQHVGIPVNDLARSREFYTNVLGLHVTQESSEWNADAPVRLHCGNEPLPGQQVVLFKRPKPLRRDAIAEDDHSHHAFLVTPEEFEVALEKFKEMGIVAPSSGLHPSIVPCTSSTPTGTISSCQMAKRNDFRTPVKVFKLS
jgi:catechol 2,3-dioxygenase-like lactoylglutathione lyase family enzyme